MEQSVRSFEHRRRKYLSYRNIYIRNAIFKVGLFIRILKVVQLYDKVRSVFTSALYDDSVAFIECIYHELLDILIQLIVKRIYPYSLLKNLLKILSYLRHRVRNDRKASLLSLYISVCYLSGLCLISDLKLLLHRRKRSGIFLYMRYKRLFTEYLYTCRARMLTA